MRLTPTYDAALGKTRIAFASDCHTDALPLLRAMHVRRQDVDLTSQSLPLALAILAAPYVGEQFEVAGVRIGNDYAEAIRTVLGRPVGIASVDGVNRTISTGEFDVLCGPSSLAGIEPMVRSTSAPLLRATWSGDFVNPARRRSDGFAFGDYHTNAALVADPVRVSIALGLLHGRDRCRTLFVRGAGMAKGSMEAIRRALWIVGVNLELMPA